MQLLVYEGQELREQNAMRNHLFNIAHTTRLSVGSCNPLERCQFVAAGIGILSRSTAPPPVPRSSRRSGFANLIRADE